MSKSPAKTSGDKLALIKFECQEIFFRGANGDARSLFLERGQPARKDCESNLKIFERFAFTADKAAALRWSYLKPRGRLRFRPGAFRSGGFAFLPVWRSLPTALPAFDTIYP